MLTAAKRNGNRNRMTDALLGFLLGIGAPLGWLFIRFVITHKALLLQWSYEEMTSSKGIYTYMGLGTIIAFVVFGYFLGRHNDVISQESSEAKGALERSSTMAMTDALTGIHNARYLHEHLYLEIESAKRHQTPLTCVMIDIDDFKKINDTHGHPFGDSVLATIANIIKQCTRRIDITGRLGGEEFLVIMPHTPSLVGFRVAERIRTAVQSHSLIANGTQMNVTISLGVAHYPSFSISTKTDFLKAADEALYKAKRAGKNKTVMFSREFSERL